jgi:hypothetical protein
VRSASPDQLSIRRARSRRQPMSAARKKGQLSRHARGYTKAHVARRRQLEPLVATGQASCCRCGQLIQPGEPGTSTTETTATATSAPHTQPATSAPPQKRRTPRERTIR